VVRHGAGGHGVVHVLALAERDDELGAGREAQDGGDPEDGVRVLVVLVVHQPPRDHEAGHRLVDARALQVGGEKG
jgi:hypothetical protein